MQKQSQPIQTLEQLANNKACTNCSHLTVCTIFRAVASLLQNWEKDKPIETENLAKICKVFESNTVANLLREQP